MIFNRYLYKTLYNPIIFSTLSCTFLLLVDFLSEIIQNIVIKKVPFLKVMEIILCNLIPLLNLSIPMGIMIGLLIGYSNLALSNEIIALKSLGINLKNLILPSVFIGLLFSSFLFLNDHFFSYASYKKGINVIKEISYIKPSLDVESKRFIEGITNYSIYIDKYNNEKNLAENFIIFDKKDKLNSTTIGKYLSCINGKMIIEQAHQYSLSDNNVTSFEKRFIPLSDLVESKDFINKDKIEYYSLAMLLRKSKNSKYQAYFKSQLLCIFSWKLALIISPVVFSVLAPLLAIGANKRLGKSDNLSLGIIMLFVYWLWVMYSRGNIENLLVSWIPNISYLLISVFLYMKRMRG